MRFARNSYITLFSKLSFRGLLPETPPGPSGYLPGDSSFAVFVLFCKLSLDSRIALFGKCSFRIPSSFLPDFTQDQFEPFLRGVGRCVHSQQMGPGSQITFFGKCSFWIPSGSLPDFTRD